MDCRIAEVLHIIEDRPATDVETLCASVNLSSSRLRHLFQAEVCVSLQRYVREQRLLRAKGLLRASFLTVKQVCAACGFRDTGHFAREFRKSFGMPPGAFRRTRGPRAR